MGTTSGGAIAQTSKVGRGLRELALGKLGRDGAVGREYCAHHVPRCIPGEAGMYGWFHDGVGWVEQTARIHRELSSRWARLWMPGEFNGPC